MNLLAYIQGKRKGKEAHRIEREAMRDPFLADALEGYDEVKADHAERIARLRSHIPSSTRNAGQQKIYMGIAASLLLCLTVGGYFLLNKKPDNLIAMSESYQQIITEELIEISPTTETPPPPAPDYLVENEQATAAESAMRQRTTSSPASPIIVNDADVLEQAEIIVFVEEEDIKIAMNSEFVVAREAEVKEADHAVAAVLGNARATENQPVVATPLIRSDLAKEERSLPEPEPQIGMLAYEKYLKEAMNPLKKEECSQTTGIVEVEFTIKEGKPSGFVIKQSFCEAASKEAIRLIENGCIWIGEDGRTVALKIDF